ncbi:hypothetical protein LWC34_35745 [Kibdelosporangium philippinense]|uniref:Tachylectin n=1 Tax=Kibdelosporangium philippinense TaxID=211113 RepID=A0ABS8ZNT3_9PSEU|nr:tachylectin-related carbohydrate-binding protein [Kibdelosporangium philippinense]MCE7008133.1 hypothetical protein [Kibdelosporangium philippinense]
MRSRGALFRRSGLAAVALITASAVQTTPVLAAPAQAEPVLTCKTAANIFGVRPEIPTGGDPKGALAVYPHEEPETGQNKYGEVRVIGSGWHGVRTLAGPDGVMFQVHTDGKLRRYRWNGRGWDEWNGLQYRDVGTGWQRFTDPDHRNKITVDENGRIFTIAADGWLRAYTWRDDVNNGSFSNGRALDTGWGQYDLIVAAGDGVLYARKPNGELFRFRWDSASDRFTQYGLRVATGWGKFKKVTSVGGDVLYTVDAAGVLNWTRYLETSNTWKAPTAIGTSWHDEIDIVGDPKGCWVTGYPRPEAPGIPRQYDAPNTAIQGTDGKVTVFYVNSEGALTAGKQTGPDFSNLQYTVIANYRQSTGKPGVGVRADGRFDVVANSYDDATFRGKLQQTTNGDWGPTAPDSVHSGYMVGDPVVIPEPNKALTMYAVDVSGALWRRTQSSPSTDYTAWQQISPIGAVTPEFTAVRNGTDADFVTRRVDGIVLAATFAANKLSAWRIVGTGAVDRPAVAVHPNGDLRVAVRTFDGAIVTQRESNNVFSGEWQPTAAISAVGSPAVVVRPSDIADVTVRATNNLVHVTSQVAPAGAFREWQVHNVDEAVTDPTGLLLSNGSPIFTWRNANGGVQFLYEPSVGRFTSQSSRP